ncbi:hypothetical protein QWY28_10830 [Nocardioides sp. SOB77]|uniref:Uncharacterized protein n=1 Tax=Nocardioides oceani TaxID=3058369 RepID=A0ABT8FFY9_9ACTN|nr:hypothetical protein [Nocardioides oceani]MDN4173439.1 hypothetical protein [Nocardioides oceani]
MTTTPLLTVPLGWHHHPDPAPDVLVAARGGPPLGSGVAPELVLRRTEVPARHLDDLAGWRASALAGLGRLLDGFAVEDEEVIELEGRDVAYARFGHRGVGVDLVTEQWSWLLGGRGLTLSATVALEDYADLYDVLEDAAGSVEPGALMTVV